MYIYIYLYIRPRVLRTAYILRAPKTNYIPSNMIDDATDSHFLSFSCPADGFITFSSFSVEPICSMMMVITDISFKINRDGQRRGLVAAPGVRENRA